ncbi:MAG: ABC transporter permease [Actinomycetota bacterium]|nr:ABC transporter permease [Actinomycetota bacterium]
MAEPAGSQDSSLGASSVTRSASVDEIAPRVEVDSRPSIGPRTSGLSRYAGLIFSLAQRQLKLRYKQSALGWLWTLILPLSSLVTYMIVFGIFLAVSPPVAGNGHLRSFTLFLFSGLIAWNLFSSILTGSMAWMLELGPLLKKVAFPPEAPVFGGAGSSLVQTATESVLLLVILAIFGNVSFTFLLLPVLILLLAMFATGIGLIAALTNVYFRDVEHLVEVALMVLFYATPIVYPIEIVPRSIWGGLPVRTLVQWNPTTVFVQAIRGVLYGLQVPSLGQGLALVALASVSFGSGLWIFKRYGASLGEEL